MSFFVFYFIPEKIFVRTDVKKVQIVYNYWIEIAVYKNDSIQLYTIFIKFLKISRQCFALEIARKEPNLRIDMDRRCKHGLLDYITLTLRLIIKVDFVVVVP